MGDLIPPTALRAFWARMAAIYGHKWATAYGERCDREDGTLTVAGDTWQRGLAGMGASQLGVGLRACIAAMDDWPPSLPQFRAMCLGIPSLAAVRVELGANAVDRSPFTRLVWSKLDSFRMRSADTETAARMVREAYEVSRDAVMRGAPMPEPAAAEIAKEPEPEPKPSDPAKVAAVVDQLKEALKL